MRFSRTWCRELLEAAKGLLAALEEEAVASLSLDVAEANFSDPAPERERAASASEAAGVAMQRMRDVIAAAPTWSAA